MKLVRWKRFTWDLSKLPTTPPSLSERYALRPAFADDREAVEKIILAAFRLDSEWSALFQSVPTWLKEQIDTAFDRETAPAVVITHGLRVIAASLITTEVDAETHLLSGPCVSMEYRNRGLGTALLYGTLAQRGACLLLVRAAPQQANQPLAAFPLALGQREIAQHGRRLARAQLERAAVQAQRKPPNQRDGQAWRVIRHGGWLSRGLGSSSA